jgi:hypothetical protein
MHSEPGISVVLPTGNEARNLPRMCSHRPPGLVEVKVTIGRGTASRAEKEAGSA